MVEKERQRDWDKELAEVDKLLAKLPNADPTLGRGAGVRAPQAAPPAVPGGSAFGAWVRVGLAVTLAIGMALWPYAHDCGLQLAYYSGGVVMLIVAGVWGAASSWGRRSATGHVLSLGALFWGLALAAAVILPRAGYAQPAATWLCQ
jgi:hypothetical protein